MSGDMEVKEGRLYGGWREPLNIWQDEVNSIHNEDVARKIGMRGGTIPGTIHLNLFPPLLIELFGQRWFERGSISMYYTFATKHREPVRAVIALPPQDVEDIQVEAWVEMQDGQLVAKGTIAIGEPDAVSYVRAIGLKSNPDEELRILANLKAGQEIPPKENVVISREEMNRKLETITDPIDWYRGQSPWGTSIVNPDAMYGALNIGFPLHSIHKAVGFFGATEIRIINGPIRTGIPYRTTGRIACVGTSLKTEFAWVDSWLREKDTRKLIAEMRHLTRWMKVSSPLYQEE